MNNERFITVAIHTYERAVLLKSILENEGISVVLNNVNLETPVVSSGIRVRIKEHDLPLALRIIENLDIFAQGDLHRETQSIVVPVDFSEHSINATILAFHLAKRHNATIKLLHSFIDPRVSSNIQLTDKLTYEIIEEEECKQLIENAKVRMDAYIKTIKALIKNGTIPAVKFSSDIHEGVPEDVIGEFAKNTKPLLVVMSTRDSNQKEKEMIGSVTAEVFNSSRFPILSIPRSEGQNAPSKINHIVFFCNLDQEDILAFDTMYRIMKNLVAYVTIAFVPGKKRMFLSGNDSIDALVSYCRAHYSELEFGVKPIDLENLSDEFYEIEKVKHIDMIAMPNKKKNVFSRMFNPGLAHKILINADIPMMVIPI